MVARPALLWIAPILAMVVGRAIFMRFDQRPFVEHLSGRDLVPRLGPATPPLAAFKAITRAKIASSAAFRSSPTPFPSRRTLSWWRALAPLGDCVPAHVGSLTLWATQVGLNRDALMRALQTRIVSAQAPGPRNG